MGWGQNPYLPECKGFSAGTRERQAKGVAGKTVGLLPELNPAKQVWAYLKIVLLKNEVFKTLAGLKEKVVAAMETIKNDKELIKSFFCYPNIGFYANSNA